LSSVAIYFQTFGSSAGGVLAVQSLLLAIGLNNINGALPLAATINWVLKDGIGQIGGVIFASQVNQNFDRDPKKWRFISSAALDVSCFIELLTPLCPAYFLLMASVANVGKNISYLSASASRAALHQSFAIHENLADITG
jgi:Vitamin B6 photo-protection and homoeostasis